MVQWSMPVLARRVTAVAHRPVPHDNVSPQPRLAGVIALALFVDADEFDVLVAFDFRGDHRLDGQIEFLDGRQCRERVFQNGDDMRIAHVHESAARGAFDAGDRDLIAVQLAALPCAHLHLEHVLAEARHVAERREGLHSGAGAEAERPATGPVGEPLALREQRDGPRAVAAHLREGAVGVAVVHEPFGAVGLAIRNLRVAEVGDRARMRETDQTVAADAEMTVAQVPHLVGGRLVFAVTIGVDDEIVACGVCFVNNAWDAHTIHSTRGSLLKADVPWHVRGTIFCGRNDDFNGTDRRIRLRFGRHFGGA